MNTFTPLIDNSVTEKKGDISPLGKASVCPFENKLATPNCTWKKKKKQHKNGLRCCDILLSSTLTPAFKDRQALTTFSNPHGH